MKKIIIGMVILFFAGSCKVLKPTYPGQSLEGRKSVPSDTAIFTRTPIPYQIGKVKYIHDVRNNAFILFKGASDTLLDKMESWLPNTADEVIAAERKPAVVFTVTPIAPYTLFTREELNSMGTKDKDRVKELAGYRTYGVTISDFTYEDLILGHTISSVTTSNPDRSKSNSEEKKTSEVTKKTYPKPKNTKSSSQDSPKRLNAWGQLIK